MNDRNLYLKPNVVIEPLVDNWYAWSQLIAPATAAMNIAWHHTIIKSYLAAPSVHAEAVKNPKMRGGPFMDFGGGRIKEVEALQKESLRKQDRMLQFAKAVKELDQMLSTEAVGFNIEKLYERVPELLKGYVELYYDRNNNPGFRFFEALLYNSEFYNKGSQSIALWITNSDARSFCLSTPRMADPNVIYLDLPLESPVIDELARMKRKPVSYEYARSLVSIRPEQEHLFRGLFTEEVPPPFQKYIGDKVRVRYFGHACILVETDEVSILIDPLISYYGYDSTVDHFSDADLPETIDCVLITHGHQDHILLETLLPLRHRIKNLLVPRNNNGRLEDPDLKLMFEHIGFKNVIALDEMQTYTFRDASITSLPFVGEHGDLNILAKSCHHVRIGEFTLLALADSRVVESRIYQHVHKQIGDADVMFLGMECDGAPLTHLYGPLLTKKLPRDMDGTRRLGGSNCDQGMALVDIFKPREAYVYAMGQEPWCEFISSIKYTPESNPIVQSDKLVKLCKERGLAAERLLGHKELLYEKQPELLKA